MNGKQTDYREYLRFGGTLNLLETDIPENTPIMYNGRVVGHTTGKNSINHPVKCVLYPYTLHIEARSVQDNVTIDVYEVASFEVKND